MSEARRGAAPVYSPEAVATERVRVFTDPALVPASGFHVPLLEPFLGRSHDKYGDPRSPVSGRLRAWAEQGADVFELAPLEQAHVGVLPAGWEHYAGVPELRAAALAYAKRVREAGVPLVAFFGADSLDPVPLPGAHVFRPSLARSRAGEREYAMPALSLDVVDEELGGVLTLRTWRARPVVGFCGHAPEIGPRGWPRSLARRALRKPPHPAHVRTRACALLSRSRGVETNFVFRPAYWAGAVQRDGSLDFGLMRAARAAFVANLVDSDYVLAVRGGGNYSFRLYEALSCGRIPVFVDTDCVLPFEEEIDWRSICVWIPEAELAEIGGRVADFHARLGPEGFAERQLECRRVFAERLAPEAFFRSLAAIFRGLEP